MMLALRMERKTQESYLTAEGKRMVKGKGSPMRTPMQRHQEDKAGVSAAFSPTEAPQRRYILWSLAVLRKVCLHRGIKGQQRNNDKDAMAKLLEGMDQKAGRPSTYTGDFGGDLSPAKGERSKLPLLRVQQGASAMY